MRIKKTAVSDSLQQGTTPDSGGQQCFEALVDSKVIAELLGLEVRTVRTMTAQKRIPHFKVGGTAVRYRISDVLAHLESKSPKWKR